MLGNDVHLFDVHWKELRTLGWENEDFHWPDNTYSTKYEHASRVRLVGDGTSLIVPLDTELIRPSPTPDYAIEYSQFVLGYVGTTSVAGEKDFFLDVSSGILESVALQYSYTCSTKCERFMRKRLKRWYWLERYKLDPKDVPPDWQYGHLFKTELQFPEGFEMPRSWNYADHLLPLWDKEWERIGNKEYW